MDSQIQQLIELQTKQNQLLERYLWRFRFSLMTLLVLTTGICICLGVMIYLQPTAPRPAPAGPWTTPTGITYAPATGNPVDPVPIMPTNNAQFQPVFPTFTNG